MFPCERLTQGHSPSRRGLPTPLIRPLRHLSPDIETYILTFLGTFGSILIACGVSYALSLISSSDGVAAFDAIPLTVGSFGASAVLLYATPESPLSQPRNVIGGQTFSAIAGSVISQLFALNGKFTAGLNSRQDNTVASPGSWPSLVPLSGAFSVGIATLTMQLTGTVHPPGESVRGPPRLCYRHASNPADSDDMAITQAVRRLSSPPTTARADRAGPTSSTSFSPSPP